MHALIIVMTMAVLPIFSIGLEAEIGAAGTSMPLLIGKWFVFWAVGIRLLLAGLTQALKPQFTAEILGLSEKASLMAVRELGFANIAFGALGALSLVFPTWITPGAVAGGLFLGLAGINHAFRAPRSRNESIAMISDLGVAIVLAVYMLIGLSR